MSALSDHGRALLILHRIGHMPGAAVLLMDDPEVARAVREVTEWVDGLRLSSWPAVPVSDPDTEARCAALSAEFAAEAAATSDGGWG